MNSETYSQNDFNFLPFSNRDDDVNSLEYNINTQNPYTSNIIGKYEKISNIKPECPSFNNFDGPPKSPKSDMNLENEKNNFGVDINYIEQNENKIIFNSKDFTSSNFQKQTIRNPFKSNKPSEPDKFENSVSTNPNTKKIKKQEKKEKNENKKNLKIKTKRIIINVLIDYTNYTIKKVYGGKIGNGVFNQKIIRQIKSSEIENITINHIKQLLHKTIKEILSTDISKKYTSVLSNFNEKIINDLLNEENEDKRKIFNDLFNKTFLDWILMLFDPKGELKDVYEEELHKNKKRDENEINKINQMIKNFEVEFLNKKKVDE